MKTQALILANDLFAGLNDGGKRLTIRTGRRDIQLGRLVFRPSKPSKKIKPVNVSVCEVRYKRLEAITDEEAVQDGFADALSVLDGMRRFYPDIRPEDEVTLVYFDC
jgi:hypothetical protein